MTKYEWERELRRNLERLPKFEADRAVAFYDELFADKAERGYSEKEIISEFGNPFDVANSIIRDYNEGGDSYAPQQFNNNNNYRPPVQPNGGSGYGGPPVQPNGGNGNNAGMHGYGNDSGHTQKAGENLQNNRRQHIYQNNQNQYNDPNQYAGQNQYFGQNNAGQVNPGYGQNAGWRTRQAERKGAAGAILRLIFALPYFILVIVTGSLLISFGAAAFGCILGGIFYAGVSFTMISSGGAAVFAAMFGASLAAVGVGGLFMMSLPALWKITSGATKVFFGVNRKSGDRRAEVR